MENLGIKWDKFIEVVAYCYQNPDKYYQGNYFYDSPNYAVCVLATFCIREKQQFEDPMQINNFCKETLGFSQLEIDWIWDSNRKMEEFIKAIKNKRIPV